MSEMFCDTCTRNNSPIPGNPALRPLLRLFVGVARGARRPLRHRTLSIIRKGDTVSRSLYRKTLFIPSSLQYSKQRYMYMNTTGLITYPDTSKTCDFLRSKSPQNSKRNNAKITIVVYFALIKRSHCST